MATAELWIDCSIHLDADIVIRGATVLAPRPLGTPARPCRVGGHRVAADP